MSITKRQFDLLQAMGINVWQRRDLFTCTNKNSNSSELKSIFDHNDTNQTAGVISSLNDNDSSQSNIVESNLIESNLIEPNLIEPNLTALRKQQIFNDIIQCLGVSSCDLLVHQSQIDLGLINWQFHKNQKIEFHHNCLRTPELSILATSAQMKKLLWQSIQHLST